eukprot:jgi/Psemu1/236216/estExt_Genewise1.C_420003
MTEQPKEDNRMSELERLEKEFGVSTEILTKSKGQRDSGALNEIEQKYDKIEREQSEVASRLLEVQRIEERNVNDSKLKEQTRSRDLQFLQEITRDSNDILRDGQEVVSSSEENRPDEKASKLADKITKIDELYTPNEQVFANTALLLKEVMGPSLENYSGKEAFFSERDATVQAGNTLSVPVRISTPGTVVEFSIEKKSYDFGFGISAFMDEGKVAKIREMTTFRKKTETESIVVPAGCAPCTMQFKFANSYSTLLEKARVGYKIRVIPPSAETIKLGRRRRAESSLKLLESELESQRQILETSNARVVDLERQAMELQNDIIEKSAKLETIMADEERLKKVLDSVGQQQQQQQQQPTRRGLESDKFFNDF